MTEDRRFHKRTLFLVAYLLFAVLPIYWMVNMSFKTNEEILSSFSLWPQHFTWANYQAIFTDASWYSGYINSLIYVAINTVIRSEEHTRLNSSHLVISYAVFCLKKKQ